MIAIKNVDFSYTEGKKHGSIQNITINIASGECVLLCGKSGCGKTTITKLINGLIPHFNNGELSGETVVDDMKVADTPLYKLSQKVGSVFQNPKSQFFNIDSDSELAFGLENNGVAPEKIKTRIDKTVSDLHIEHLLHRNVFSMSGGEKQSLAFASVYAMNPDIYVLDEPSANLDIGAVERLKAQIQQIKLQGKSIVIAEHRLYYLTDLIDRVIVIADGHIEKEFTREEFISLTNEECHKMGLRSLTVPEHIAHTSADSTGTLEIKHLTVKNKKHIIFEDLNFSISEGNILGVLGENGAGKTTLMRCLSGLIKEHSGDICYKGKPMKPKSRNKLCNMIMQDVNHQLFGESVWNECELCKDKNITDEQIEQILKSFDLFEFKDKHPMALSGGRKQRLAIATGVIAEKIILIFDEPTSGLDYEHMVTVSETLKHLADLGHIIIVVTHDLEFLNSTCDAVIQIGKIFENPHRASSKRIPKNDK